MIHKTMKKETFSIIKKHAPIRFIPLFLVTSLFLGCNGISEITAFDNHDPENPVAILSSVPLPQWDTPQPGDCGCRAGETPQNNNAFVRGQDGRISCDEFRPIEARHEGNEMYADLRFNVSDDEGVSCVQFVLSPGDIENASSGDIGAVSPPAMVEGECADHVHHANEPDNAIHYKVEYDGSRRGQNPSFSYQRRALASGWRSLIGGKLFMEYWDGDGELNQATKWVYFYGPRESACTM